MRGWRPSKAARELARLSDRDRKAVLDQMIRCETRRTAAAAERYDQGSEAAEWERDGSLILMLAISQG
jgi:hypothetical protein